MGRYYLNAAMKKIPYWGKALRGRLREVAHVGEIVVGPAVFGEYVTPAKVGSFVVGEEVPEVGATYDGEAGFAGLLGEAGLAGLLGFEGEVGET